jgi:hypothetical protein
LHGVCCIACVWFSPGLAKTIHTDVYKATIAASQTADHGARDGSGHRSFEIREDTTGQGWFPWRSTTFNSLRTSIAVPLGIILPLGKVMLKFRLKFRASVNLFFYELPSRKARDKPARFAFLLPSVHPYWHPGVYWDPAGLKWNAQSKSRSACSTGHPQMHSNTFKLSWQL